jgi:hypothetical protein
LPPLHEHPEFNDRMAQAKRSAVKDLLKELGFTDVESEDALKAAKGKLGDDLKFAKEQRDAQLTAEQRVQQQITDLTAERDRLIGERDQALARAQTAEQTLITSVRDAELRKAAEVAGARHPEDVITWAQAYAAEDLGKVLKEEKLADGTTKRSPDADAIKRIIDACFAARKDAGWFKGSTVGSPSNQGGQPPRTVPEVKGQVEAGKAAARAITRRA